MEIKRRKVDGVEYVSIKIGGEWIEVEATKPGRWDNIIPPLLIIGVIVFVIAMFKL